MEVTTKMETNLKEKLLRTSPFEAIKKIVNAFQNAGGKLFAENSFIAAHFKSNEASKPSQHSLFKHVTVNYPYLKRMQPNLYGQRRRSDTS